MQLPQNQKYFLNFFLNFRNLQKFETLWKKKNETQRLFVSEIIDCKKQGYLNA